MRRDDEADEPHVVVERQPADALVALGVERQAVEHDRVRVGREVAVGDHHALGRRRAPRRELEEREIVAGDRHFEGDR